MPISWKNIFSEFQGAFVVGVTSGCLFTFNEYFLQQGGGFLPPTSFTLANAVVLYVVTALFMLRRIDRSGGILNPTLTLPLMLFGKINFFDGLFFLAAQSLGLLLAAGAITGLVPNKIENPSGQEKAYSSDIFPFRVIQINGDVTRTSLSFAVIEAFCGFIIMFMYYIGKFALKTEKKHLRCAIAASGYLVATISSCSTTGGLANPVKILADLLVRWRLNYIYLKIDDVNSIQMWTVLVGAVPGAIVALIVCMILYQTGGITYGRNEDSILAEASPDASNHQMEKNNDQRPENQQPLIEGKDEQPADE